MSKRFNTVAFSLAMAFVSGAANAAISLTDGSLAYSQNFDSLVSPTTNPNTNTIAWVNDSTLAGWSLFTKDSTAISTYRGDNGSGNAGGFISYGLTGNTDRALGGLASSNNYFGTPGPGSGALAGWIAVAFQNNSSSALSGFTVGFDGEQWRNGGNTSAQSMVLQYGFGSTFAGVATWFTPGGSFDWASPVTGSTAAAVDGNAAGLVTGLGGTINTTWNAGDTLWVRWIENNDVGNDHGLAIDNFTLTAAGETPATVPVPAALWLMGSGLGLLGVSGRRRRA